MTYTKPGIARVELVAQMIFSQSVCEQQGGTWEPGYGCKREA